MKKTIVYTLLWSFLFQNTAAFAVMTNIQIDGRTQTQINQAGNIYDISTNTNVGDMGVNSFNKFDVGNGTTVNLNLQDTQNKLLNLIYDNSASQINGIVNSYKNGAIGGNVMFANSKGFVIGKDGVFNVGALTLMTPDQKTMDSLFKNGQLLKQPITDLISYQIDEDRLLKLKGDTKLSADGKIDMAGRINAQKGVDIIAGNEVNVSGHIKANVADVLVNTPDASFTTAINNGNNIIIVANNDFAGTDESFGNLVKISGQLDAGAKGGSGTGRDVLIAAQSGKTHNKAEVQIKSGAKVIGQNVQIEAVQKVTDFSSNAMNISDEDKENAFIFDDIVEHFAPSIAELSAKVVIENGAQIKAFENLSIASAIHAQLSASVYMAMLALNYVRLDAQSTAQVNSGAKLTAKNLNVTADTQIDLSATSKSTSLNAVTDINKLGDLAAIILLEDIKTNAFIENGAILDVNRDVKVSASTDNSVDAYAKNGIIPVLDTNNKGAFSGSVLVGLIDAQTKAAMNADLSITGALDVTANARGQLSAKSEASAGGDGETGFAAKYGKTFAKNLLFGEGTGTTKLTGKMYDKMNDIRTRGNADFNKFDLSAAITVAVADYVTEALIGEGGLKPTIHAGNINVAAKTIDDKSAVTALSSAENAQTAIAGAVAVHLKDLQARAIADGNFTLINTNDSLSALNITSKTEVLHPLSYYQHWQSFVDSLNLDDIFSMDTVNQFLGIVGQGVVDLDNNLVMPDTSGITDKFQAPDLDILLKGPVNLSNFGLDQLYNTYAQAASSAKTQTGSTKGFSGAIAISVFDSLADAGLAKGANVTLAGANSTLNNINIDAQNKNQIWTMSGIFKPTEALDFMQGAGARDGSAYGAGIAFNYANNDTSAYVGENVVINQTSGKMGNVDITAQTNGHFVTTTFGSSNADETGMSGAIGLTLVGGDTQAYTAKGADIKAKDLNVIAKNDTNYINAITGFSTSDKAVAFGISGIGLFDNIKAYIDGTVYTEGNVTLDATSDRLLVNVTNNVGIAKAGTNPPQGSKQNNSQDVMNADEGMSLANSFVGLALGSGELPSAWERTKADLAAIEEVDKLDNNWERTVNPDKETSSYAGSISANVITSTVESYIADNAVVRSLGDINIGATADILTVTEGGAVSANGKTGGGGAVVADVITTTVTAGIGNNANVDARRHLNVDALQDYLSIQAGVGVAVAKNSSGAGTVGSLVQVNTTKAYIGAGAQINQLEDRADEEQSVNLNAKNDTLLIKGLGAMSVQAGATQGAQSAKAVGGTIDGNVLVNTAQAVIEGTENNRTAVAAKKALTLNSENKNTIINADIAGSVATGGNAYAGLASSNILINTTNAGMKYTDVTGTADVDIEASDVFKEVAVAGTAAIGRDTAMGASVRADVLNNAINTFVENATLTANSLDMTNTNKVSQVSVIASGAASNDKNAYVGSIGTLIALSDQKNRIQNSTVTLANSANLKAMSVLDSVAVTGAAAASNAQTAVGGSLFALIAGNDVSSSIENSTLKAVAVTADASSKTNVTAITAGGSLAAGGSAYQGAVSTLTDIGNTDAYIDGGSITADSVSVAADKTIDTLQLDGQVSVSLSDKAMGGALSSTINTNKTKAYIQNAVVTALNGINVTARSVKNFITIPVGVSAGADFTAQGSVDTYVIVNEVDAYIKNSTLSSQKNVMVTADDQLNITSTAGGASASFGGSAVGAAMFTGVLTGHTRAYVDTVTLQTAMENLKVGATSSENLDVYSVSGSVGLGGFAATGVVQTLVVDKDTLALVKGVKAKNGIDKATVTADSTLDLTQVAGQAAVSASSVGAGGSAETLVVNKGVNAHVNDSELSVQKNLDVNSNAAFKNTGVVTGVSVGANAAVQGAVSTKVLDVDVTAGIDKSTVAGTANQQVTAKNTFDVVNTLATLSASGTAAVGGTVGSLVNNSSSTAEVKGSQLSGKTLTVDSTLQDNYTVTLANAAASGSAAVAGGVNTVVLNTSSVAQVNDSDMILAGDASSNADMKVNALNETTLMSNQGQAAGSGSAAIGAGVSSLVFNKQTTAQIRNSTADIAGSLSVLARSIDDVFSGVAGGAGAGAAAVVGSVNTVVFDNETQALIDNSGIDIQGNATVKADENLILSGFAGAAAGAGTAAVGASVFTGVIGNKTFAQITQSDIVKKQAAGGTLDVIANSIEKIGSKESPLINVAGSGAGIANVNGVVNTFTNTSQTSAVMKGTKTARGIAIGNTAVKAAADTTLFAAQGSAGGAGIASVGATVGTFVVNKDVTALVDKTVMNVGNMTVDALSKDNISTTTVAGGGAGAAAVNGAVGTHVIQNNVSAGVTQAQVTAKDLTVLAKQDTDLFTVAGSVSGALVGVGASVLTNVLENKVSALVDSNVTAQNVSVTSQSDENFTNNTVSGAGGAVGAAGAVTTNIIGNEVSALLKGDITASQMATVSAKDLMTFDEQATGMVAGGAVGAGASVQTNTVNNNVKAGIGGTITAQNLSVLANAEEHMTKLFALGFAAGMAGGAGTTLVNTINTSVQAYSENATDVTVNDKFTLNVDSKTHLNSLTTTGVGGVLGGVGASVVVNTIAKNVQAYTGVNTLTKNAKNVSITASSINNIGEKNNTMKTIAGTAGTGLSIAGSVLSNTVQDTVAAGLGASNVLTADALTIKAQNDTSVYTDVGGGSAGFIGVGAMVNVNTVNNTTNAFIGNGTHAATSGDTILTVTTNSTLVNNGYVIGGGGLALSGGVVVSNVGSAQADLSADAETQRNAQSAKNQAETATVESNQKVAEAKKHLTDSLTDAQNRASEETKTAQNNANSTLSDGLKANLGNTQLPESLQNYETPTQMEVVINLPQSTGMTPPPVTPVLRAGMTSAFVDSDAVVTAKNFTLSAVDNSKLDLYTFGGTFGAAAVGVSGAAANVSSTVEALLGTNTRIEAGEKIKVSATSSDAVSVDTTAAAGGAIAASGTFALANSNKTTRVQTLTGTTLTSLTDAINIAATAAANSKAYTWGGNFGGLAVGAAISQASATGQTVVNMGAVNQLKAAKTVDVSALSNMVTNSTANAIVGALIGATGADSRTWTGQNVSVDMGGNTSISSGEDILIKADGTNKSNVVANARAYGVVAGGGAVAVGEVTALNRINLANGQGVSSKIIGRDMKVTSNLNNDVFAKTLAGTGGIIGIGGSQSKTLINASNTVNVGTNYDIDLTRHYGLLGNTQNAYRSYTDSSAYGVVAAGAGLVNNDVHSNVLVGSYADALKAKGSISLYAANATEKKDNGYDLEGGAGGLVGVGSANLKSNIAHDTKAVLGGNTASTAGELSVLAENNVNVTEKVKVDAAGGVPIASGYAHINRNGSQINAETTISNKNIRADQDVLYGAKSHIAMYSKSDVTTRGLAPIAEGESFSTGQTNNKVVITNNSQTDGRRDVFVEALGSMRVTSEMRSDSGGLLWDFGDADVQAKGIMNNAIDLQTGSLLSAFDKMTLTARDGASLTGTKSARTKFYLIFGIPITRYNDKNSDKNLAQTSYSGSSNIYLNGDLKSGEGAVRYLTIETDKDGNVQYSGNIQYSKDDMKLAVSEEDVAQTQSVVEGSYEKNKEIIENGISANGTLLSAAQTTQKENKAAIENADQNIQIATDNSRNYLNLKQKEPSSWTENEASQIKSSILASNLENRDQLAAKIQVNPTLADGDLTLIQTALDQSSNKELAKITGYETAKELASHALAQNTIDIQKYETEDKRLVDLLKERTQAYEKMMAELNDRKAEAAGGSLTLTYTDIKDTTVRSGEVVLNGTVSGSGNISAPGNAFSITVNNNTPGTVNFNNLIIEDDVRGKIYINGRDALGMQQTGSYNGIGLALRNKEAAPQISLNNNVDANDPSFSINRLNNAGDMMFNGLVQNTNGAITLRNLTGNIVSEGTMVAKSISMFVPNGDMKQGFTNSQVDVAGMDGKGSGIYAGGDIEIMARTINVNGVIQSGTADKSVVINPFELSSNCDANSCSQKIGDKWVELEKSPNKQKSTWYLLNGDATTGIDMTNVDNPETIKAYYDIATGEIILFRAEITGGDITLVGDVVSTGNGEIKLMSGYGHITIDNKSGKNLVVNELNADRKIDGKLTIYDFNSTIDALNNEKLMDSLAAKYQSADKNDLKNSAFWNEISQYTYEYTAQKDMNGKVVVTNNVKDNLENEAKMQISGNGAVFKPTPGSIAQGATKEGYLEVSVYVPRSWIVELFDGKKYRTELVPYSETEHLQAANDIHVKFMGYDQGRVNITSNSDTLKISEDVSVRGGQLSIANTGNIIVDTLNEQAKLTANDLSIRADGTIGQETNDVQELSVKADVSGGKLFVGGYKNQAAQDVYVALVNGDADNYDIAAQNLAYVNVVNGDFLATGSNQTLKALNAEIMAANGSVQISNNQFETPGELSILAKGNIDVQMQNDINARAVYSSSGNVNLSAGGSINAVSDEDDFLPNVIGQDVSFTAKNGHIGLAQDGKELKIQNTGKVRAGASGNVNLRSSDNMFVDQITAGGNARLVSELGIINANENNTYNVKAHDLMAVANMGNIENLDGNLDGNLYAYAGYRDVNGEWKLTNSQSSVTINQISKLYTDEEVQNLTIADVADMKDLKIGHILGPNIFLNSQRSILNAGNGVVLNGQKAVLTAVNGDVGSSNAFMTVGLDQKLAAYAKDNVYIESPEKDLRVYEIIGINDKQSGGLNIGASPLKTVHLKTSQNILDENDDTFDDENGKDTVNEAYNVIAQNIILDATKGIGTDYDDFNVLTLGSKSNGLTATTNGSLYLSSLTDLNIQSLNVVGQTLLTARHMDESLTDIWHDINLETYQGGQLTVHAQNVTLGEAHAVESIKLTAIEDMFANTVTSGTDMTLTAGNNIMADEIAAGSTLKATAQNDINVKNIASGKDMTLTAGNNITVQDVTVGSLLTATAQNDIHFGKTTIGGNANLEANNALINETLVDGVLNARIDDTLSIGGSGNVTLGTVQGRTTEFINQVMIAIDGALNGKAADGQKNIYAANTDIIADSIGTIANPVSLHVPQIGGLLSQMTTNNDAYFTITGGPLTVGLLSGKDIVMQLPSDLRVLKAVVDSLTLTVEGDLMIDSISADKAYLTNGTQNLTLLEATIRDYMDVKTADKHVIMDNTSMTPRFEADVQLYAPGKTIALTLNDTPNIQTDFHNILRHNPLLVVGDTHERQSMNSTVLTDLYSMFGNERAQGITLSGTHPVTQQLRYAHYQIDGKDYENIWKRYIDAWVVLTDPDEETGEISVKELPRSAFNRMSWFRSMNVDQQHAWLRKFVNR